LTIQKLKLDGQSLRMEIDGTATAAGRLNLNVVASNGPRELSQRVVQALALRAAAAAAPPLWILEVNRLLADRTVYLKVEGTAQSPNIRVRPVPTLANESVRFLLLGF
jgi:hypothetical protein